MALTFSLGLIRRFLTLISFELLNERYVAKQKLPKLREEVVQATFRLKFDFVKKKCRTLSKEEGEGLHCTLTRRF